MTKQTLEQKVKEYIWQGIDDKLIAASNDQFWSDLKSTGTTLWLDTGDMDEAQEVWTGDFEALTTNNTLINKVIQKGIYDDFIPRTKELVASLPLEKQIMEIAFILNARHGIRLVKMFGGYVSVELHTATAYNIDDIVYYGLRYRDICPDNFIIKVPYTAAGLIGARILKEKGVRINFTLGFGVRHNILTAEVARPDYLNVFLGRVGAYIVNNGLGSGEGVGEKAVIETQKQVSIISDSTGTKTRLIAASIRHHKQLEDLAGVDVYTIPPQVAGNGRKELAGSFSSQLNTDYTPGISADIEKEGLNKFWEADKNLLSLSEKIGKDLPESGDKLEKIMRDAGFSDMFPLLSGNDMQKISDDGKIPVHENWSDMIHAGNIAPDTLLNLAGLASFTLDQGALDNRIKSLL